MTSSKMQCLLFLLVGLWCNIPAESVYHSRLLPNAANSNKVQSPGISPAAINGNNVDMHRRSLANSRNHNEDRSGNRGNSVKKKRSSNHLRGQRGTLRPNMTDIDANATTETLRKTRNFHKLLIAFDNECTNTRQEIIVSSH